MSAIRQVETKPYGGGESILHLGHKIRILYVEDTDADYKIFVGDQVLQQFGKKLTQNLRDSDLCFRYGGEEFVVLLPNADSQAARQAAEKIRRACESEKYSDGDLSVSVTVSLGVASMADLNPSDARDLPATADKALECELASRMIAKKMKLAENGFLWPA